MYQETLLIRDTPEIGLEYIIGSITEKIDISSWEKWWEFRQLSGHTPYQFELQKLMHFLTNVFFHKLSQIRPQFSIIEK